MAKVSIVIPFFNKPELLKEMVDSIINQSYKDWELLLVDDGADEKTRVCAHTFSTADKRIKVIQRDRFPKGAQTCRNIGLEKAQGEYICFFDSDDIVLPYCLQNRINFMDTHQNIDFGVFKAKTYNHLNQLNTRYFGIKQFSDDIKFFIHGLLPFAVWTNIYKTKSLRKVNASWDEKLISLQDSDFNMQNMIVRKLKYSYNEGNEDYLWRINNNGSITTKIYSNDHYKSLLYFCDKMIKMIKHTFQCTYDKDLVVRLHSICIIFAEKGDVNKINEIIELGKRHNLNIGNINSYKYYHLCIKHLNINKIKQIFQFLFFHNFFLYKRKISKEYAII